MAGPSTEVERLSLGRSHVARLEMGMRFLDSRCLVETFFFIKGALSRVVPSTDCRVTGRS